MSSITIPYGNRSVLVSDRFVFICDKILLKEDFATSEDLQAEIARIYEEYRSSCNGE